MKESVGNKEDQQYRGFAVGFWPFRIVYPVVYSAFVNRAAALAVVSWLQKFVAQEMYDVWASGLSNLSFYDFIMTEEAKKKTQGYYLFDKHKCQADKVIRFENLYEDAKNILGITITSHHNPSPKVDYRDYYNRSTREYVAWLCHKEIKEFGYEY